MPGLQDREAKRRSSLIGKMVGNEKLDQEAERLPAGRVKPKEEAKTARVNLLLKPSVHKAAKDKAKNIGTSFNEAVNQLLEIWVNEE